MNRGAAKLYPNFQQSPNVSRARHPGSVCEAASLVFYKGCFGRQAASAESATPIAPVQKALVSLKVERPGLTIMDRSAYAQLLTQFSVGHPMEGVNPQISCSVFE